MSLWYLTIFINPESAAAAAVSSGECAAVVAFNAFDFVGLQNVVVLSVADGVQSAPVSCVSAAAAIWLMTSQMPIHSGAENVNAINCSLTTFISDRT